MKKLAYKSLLAFASLTLALSSCQEEELKPYVFQTDPKEMTDFELWLDENYRKPYNIEFKYQMEDIESDYDYNLVPSSEDKARKIAYIAKHLWFGVYDEIVNDKDFMKKYAPRIIHLVGSPALNPSTGTMILGTAEGGLKITLYYINNLEQDNVDNLNTYYFKTMHHEFAHILHQTKTYPQEFNLISATDYQRDEWQYATEVEANSAGFVSPYARSENREDFVEVLANFLTKTPEQWEKVLENARVVLSKPVQERDDDGNITIVYKDDGIDGEAVILQKFEIVKNWLRDAWNIDIYAMRDRIIEVEKEVPTWDIDALIQKDLENIRNQK